MVLTTQLQQYLVANPYVDKRIEKCDPEIFANGKSIIILDSSGHSSEVEQLVSTISAMTLVPMDWHFSGGRAQVFYIGEEFEHHIVNRCIERNKLNQLVITVKGAHTLSETLFNACFDENLNYGFSIIEPEFGNYGLSYEVFVDDLQYNSIKFLLRNLEDSKDVIIEQYTRWLPCKNVGLLKLVEFGGYGLYRAPVAVVE